jgi:large subunit ribosomal protein L17
MKHRIKGRRLSRNTAHRKSLMRNLAIALINNDSIKTTLPKAKELRPFVEKLVTLAKKDNVYNRRLIFSLVPNEFFVSKIFSVTAKRSVSRNGGYTRIVKSGFRAGDKAPMAVIEMVDKPLEKNTLQNKIENINNHQ